jgi:threonine dehydrogenase-like Zn-dependent dehydrogenase
VKQRAWGQARISHPTYVSPNEPTVPVPAAVEEVGPEVKSLKRGDRVAVASNISCGQCYYCRKQLYIYCDRCVGGWRARGLALGIGCRVSSTGYRMPKLFSGSSSRTAQQLQDELPAAQAGGVGRACMGEELPPHKCNPQSLGLVAGQ